MKPATLVLAALGMTSAGSAATVFVLDGHSYTSLGNIVYRTDNQKIISPNVSDCRAGGIPVPDLPIGTTFKTSDNIHIALSAVQFNLSQSRLYLTSVFGNIVCQNGVNEDALFVSGFD